MSGADEPRTTEYWKTALILARNVLDDSGLLSQEGRGGVITFAAAQRRAWANKLAKGFNTTDVPMEFGLLVEEIGEAFSKWRKGEPGVGEELADVAIFLLGLAAMLDVDLDAEVEAKLAVNEARAYVRLPNGTRVKAGTVPS